MDLTEDQAKEILDFLAKKAGFEEIAIEDNFPTKHYTIECKKGIISYYLYAASESNKFNDILSICSMSYKDALENLLKKSREDAKDVWCCSRLFLFRHTSLEEILIEMDLENGLDRR